MSDPRDVSPAWSIVEIVLGVLIVAFAAVCAFRMFGASQLPEPVLFGDLVRRPRETAGTLGPMISLALIGLGIAIHGLVRLRRRKRAPRIAANGTRRALPLAQKSAVPWLLSALPGVGYRAFVAWRYLLVYHHKIALRTKLVLGALIAVRVLLWLVFDVGLRPQAGVEPGPLDIIGGLVLLAIQVVWFFGILVHSKIASIAYVIGLVIMLMSASVVELGVLRKLPLNEADTKQVLQVAGGTLIFGGIVSFLAWFFGSLRGRFTFFTTVPIGGVWIGTSALVLVLAVMSGFETDLRDKILGSNAHIQISKEDGDFVEWREVKQKLDAIPGVVASTPYAVSEVVIAANNNGMNVIIKGIDPKTVGNVTKLVESIEEPEWVCGASYKFNIKIPSTDTAATCQISETQTGRCLDAATVDSNTRRTALPHQSCKATEVCVPCENAAMRRLEPLIDLGHDRTVAPIAPPPDTRDPAPDDMIRGGDPIDFSGDGSGSDAGSAAGSGSGSAAPPPDQPKPDAPKPDAPKPDAPKPDAPKAAGSGSGSDTLGPPTARLDGDRITINPYGGDAIRVLEGDTDHRNSEVLDLIDSDLIRWMTGGQSEPAIHVVDIPEPSLSRRTQALPGILVGKELVKQTHLYPGEEVRVVSPLSDPSNPDATGTPIPFNRDYRVAGTFYTGMYEYDLKFVYVTLDSLQDFLDLGDNVDGIEVRIESGDDTEAYVRDGGLIRTALGPGYRVQDWRELNRSLFSALKLEKIAMFLVLGIVILVASFSIIGNLIMVVVEKQREIALLKTLGASDTGVMGMFAVQGLIIGLLGTALGIGFGLLGCFAMIKYGLPLDPDVYYINRLPIHVDPQSVIAAALTGVLISIGATLYPALLAARVRPAIGMRH